MATVDNKRTLKPVYGGFAVAALALAVSTSAMAEVKIYGRAHVSVDFLDDGGKYSKTNLSSNSPFGFQGQS